MRKTNINYDLEATIRSKWNKNKSANDIIQSYFGCHDSPIKLGINANVSLQILMRRFIPETPKGFIWGIDEMIDMFQEMKKELNEYFILADEIIKILKGNYKETKRNGVRKQRR